MVSNEKMSNLCMITGTTLCPRSSSSLDFSPKFEKNNPILFQIRKSRLSISSQYLLTRRSKIKISEKKNYSESRNLLSFVQKQQLIFRIAKIYQLISSNHKNGVIAPPPPHHQPWDIKCLTL